MRSKDTISLEQTSNEGHPILRTETTVSGCYGYILIVYLLSMIAEWAWVGLFIWRYAQHVSPLITPWVSGDVNVTDARKTHFDKNQDIEDKYVTSVIVVVVLDTLNCWLFLGIIAKSPRHGTASNPAKLVKFWFLIVYFLLYLTGTILLICSHDIMPRDVEAKGGHIAAYVLSILNALSMVIMVVFLNRTKLQNLPQGYSLYTVLRWGGLFTFWFSLTVSLITGILTINFYYVLNNGGMNRVFAFNSSVGEVLLMPLNSQLVVFIATKIFHNDKSFLGQGKGVV